MAVTSCKASVRRATVAVLAGACLLVGPGIAQATPTPALHAAAERPRDVRDTVGVRRGRIWRLRNRNSAGPADRVFRFGRAGDTPLVGDWDPAPRFRASVKPLSPALRARMRGVSWRPGCPVGLDDLALVRVRHWRFDWTVRRGRLVVAEDVADDVVTAFRRLYRARFPIRRMRLIEAYDGDDDASMTANNTSAFNCRTVGGSTTWSQHAYGTAIDLNPVQNPYVHGSVVEPEAGRRYLDRDRVRRGMIVRPGPVVRAFDRIGWGWGGDWQTLKDYQHFSANGR